MSGSRTGTHLGDECLDALKGAGGEANTDEIAGEVEISAISALGALGRLGTKGYVHKAAGGHQRGNPRWRLPVVGEGRYGA